MRARVALAVVALWFLMAGAAVGRTLLCVDLDPEASWRDMVFLAAVPAAVHANRADDGAALLALLSTEKLSPEAIDFVRRYRPTSAIRIGPGAVTPAFDAGLFLPPDQVKRLNPTGAANGAVLVSRAHWKSSPIVVLAREDDYASALVAAPLASLLGAPLLFAEEERISTETAREIRRLRASEVISFGLNPTIENAKVVTLAGPMPALTFAKRRGLDVSYVAAVNPLDRTRFVTRRLSLVGAQLAAGRGGLVAPLALPVEWKREFASTPFQGARPDGIPPEAPLLKQGTIHLGGQAREFVLSGTPNEQNLKLFLDQGEGQGFGAPLVSGDTVTLNGRTWAVSLGTRTKFGKSDVHLTWPTADEVKRRLEAGYEALGARPEHLCLVGFPDALPHAIIGRGGIVEEQASDLPFAMVRHEEFATIAVGRLIAENVEFGSVYAARTLAYGEILTPDWARRSAEAEWENSLGPLFENVGFLPPHHLAREDVPWAVPPSDGAAGQRANSFSQDSPLARSAIIAHSEHSAWSALGSTINWDATVLLAPTIVESGGCGTTCLDRDPANRTVVARLLRLGAIAFSGGSRELSAESQPLRMQFWNGLLAGETVGQAHRRAQNAGLTILRDRGEGPGGAYRYATQVRMLIGDPAATLRLPGKPRHAPARTEVSGTRVSVFGPEQWTVVKSIVPPDWKEWAGKDLYAIRGPGAFSLASWGPGGRDHETPLVMAEFVTTEPVKGIKLVTPTPAAYGWSGKWFSFARADGTYVHRFLVRMIDFDQTTGEIRGSVPRLDFEVEY